MTMLWGVVMSISYWSHVLRQRPGGKNGRSYTNWWKRYASRNRRWTLARGLAGASDNRRGTSNDHHYFGNETEPVAVMERVEPMEAVPIETKPRAPTVPPA